MLLLPSDHQRCCGAFVAFLSFRDVMSAGEFYEINGALPHTEDAFRQLMEYINRTVEEQAHEEYGLDLRSFE